MSLEAVKKVTETEQISNQRKADAVANAKVLVANAEKNGKAALEAARHEAEAQSKAMMADAEKNAANHTAEVLKGTEAQCVSLKADAQSRLKEAAQLIVRRVVNV